MFIKKSWYKEIKWSKHSSHVKLTHVYTGWFLLGIIPLYIVRKTYS